MSKIQNGSQMKRLDRIPLIKKLVILSGVPAGFRDGVEESPESWIQRRKGGKPSGC